MSAGTGAAPVRMFHASLPPEHDGLVTIYQGQTYQRFGLGEIDAMPRFREVDRRVASLGHTSGVVAPELRAKVTEICAQSAGGAS